MIATDRKTATAYQKSICSKDAEPTDTSCGRRVTRGQRTAEVRVNLGEAILHAGAKYH